MTNTFDDKVYRQKMSETFSSITKALDQVDPDMVEAELSQGVVTILCKGHTKIILSPQPPVKQIWLAAASQGIAVHFDYDSTKNEWMDDKQKGYELFKFTEGVIEKTAGIAVKLRA